jgi:hypothetical protein
MNQRLRPTDGHGMRFQTSDSLAIVVWLQSEGWAIVVDEPGMVRLARHEELIAITSDGQVTPLGDWAAQTAHALLMYCEEGNTS